MRLERSLRTSVLTALVAGTALIPGKISGQSQSYPVPNYGARFDALAGQNGLYGIEAGLDYRSVSFMVRDASANDITIENVYRALPQGLKGIGRTVLKNNKLYGFSIGVDESAFTQTDNLPILGGVELVIGADQRTSTEVSYESLLSPSNDTLSYDRNEKNIKKWSERAGVTARFSLNDPIYYDPNAVQIVLGTEYSTDKNFGKWRFSAGLIIPFGKVKKNLK